MDELRELQDWYLSHCDGNWEHKYGISIESLDNPGWTVDIGLANTELEGVPFADITDLAPEHEWLRCWSDGTSWHGAGGPLMLAPLLRRFLEWARMTRGAA